MLSVIILISLVLAVVRGLDCTGINSIKRKCESPESGHSRDVFCVGSNYVETDIRLLTYNSIYVEKLTSIGGATQPFPLVFFHESGISGAVSTSSHYTLFLLTLVVDIPQHTRQPQRHSLPIHQQRLPLHR